MPINKNINGVEPEPTIPVAIQTTTLSTPFRPTDPLLALIATRSYPPEKPLPIEELIAKTDLYMGKDKEVLRSHGSPASEIWRTRDGRQLRIAEMSNRHLYNAIKYLANKDLRSLALETELTKRTANYELAVKHRLDVKVSPQDKPVVLRNIIREDTDAVKDINQHISR